jgi:hypothetical protein
MQITDVIATDRLGFRFNSSEIVSDVTFTLKRGEFLGIVGPNGSEDHSHPAPPWSPEADGRLGNAFRTERRVIQ